MPTHRQRRDGARRGGRGVDISLHSAYHYGALSTSDSDRPSPPAIASLEDGDRVTGFALVTKKELRQDRNGNDFLDLELADASGSINGKAWSDSPALEAEFDAFDFVAYKGSVSEFKGRLQVRVQECRRVREADRAHGFDEAALIPSTREDLDDLWRRLEAALGEIADPPLGTLVGLALERHGTALREHPAAKTIHHAYRGGLLEHVVSMLELGVAVCRHYPDLDRDLVLAGILFHDLGKLREIGAMPVNEYTDEGRLVGHVVIGRDLVLELARQVPDLPTERRLQLEHIVLSHQGRLEYGAAVPPLTAEALTVHFIDDLDSKLNQFRTIGGSPDVPQYLRGLGRWVYPLEAAATAPPAERSTEAGEEHSDAPPEKEPEDDTDPPQGSLDL